MGKRIISCFMLIQLLATLFYSSGTKLQQSNQQSNQENKKIQVSISISTTKKDITTPITTVPTITPNTPTTTNPSLNPTVTNPDITNPVNPVMTPVTTSPISSGASWCIASQSASKTALQIALDYACGPGKVDCSIVQAGGTCYIPNTLRDHASFAFNSYYQKNPIPTSCNFGGTAVTTSTNPSYSTCQYPSISMSASVLNITNSSGSRVYGAGPTIPASPGGAARSTCSLHFNFILTSIVMLLVRKPYIVMMD